MSKIGPLLLDTNIWLDLYLAERPGHACASRLFRLAAEHDITLLYAIGTIKDVYYLACSHLKRSARAANGGVLTEGAATAAEEVAVSIAANMDSQATAVGADRSDVWTAIRQRGIHRDLEDNMIVAASMRAGASVLVTNDERLLRHCMVAAHTAEDTCRWIEGAAMICSDIV